MVGLVARWVGQGLPGTAESRIPGAAMSGTSAEHETPPSDPLPEQGAPGAPPYSRFEKAAATMLRAVASLISVAKKGDAAVATDAMLFPAMKSAREAGKLGVHPSGALHSAHVRPSP